jgi:hypothetical protein
MQQTGLVDSLNAIRAVAMEYGQPICMLVGLQGPEPDRPAAQSSSYGVRIVPAILAAMGLDHFSIDSPADEAALTGAIDRADAVQRPFVALIGRTVTA